MLTQHHLQLHKLHCLRQCSLHTKIARRPHRRRNQWQCTLEKTEQTTVSSTEAPSPMQSMRSADLPPMSEQEAELKALEVLPTREARLETLALWVGAAVAFGAGVW